MCNIGKGGSQFCISMDNLTKNYGNRPIEGRDFSASIYNDQVLLCR